MRGCVREGEREIERERERERERGREGERGRDSVCVWWLQKVIIEKNMQL